MGAWGESGWVLGLSMFNAFFWLLLGCCACSLRSAVMLLVGLELGAALKHICLLGISKRAQVAGRVPAPAPVPLPVQLPPAPPAPSPSRSTSSSRRASGRPSRCKPEPRPAILSPPPLFGSIYIYKLIPIQRREHRSPRVLGPSQRPQPQFVKVHGQQPALERHREPCAGDCCRVQVYCGE